MDKKLFNLLLVFALLVCGAVGKSKTKVAKRRNASKFVPKVQMKGCIEDICNGTQNYPEKYVASALARNPKFSEFNGTAMKLFENVEVRSRWGGLDEENMCATQQYFMFPTHARNTNLEWKFIVQVGEFKQAVHFEACRPKASCFAETFVPLNYKTSCKQRKVAIKMLAMSPDGEVTTDHFPVPGGCVCTYKFTSGSAEKES